MIADEFPVLFCPVILQSVLASVLRVVFLFPENAEIHVLCTSTAGRLLPINPSVLRVRSAIDFFSTRTEGFTTTNLVVVAQILHMHLTALIRADVGMVVVGLAAMALSSTTLNGVIQQREEVKTTATSDAAETRTVTSAGHVPARVLSVKGVF